MFNLLTLGVITVSSFPAPAAADRFPSLRLLCCFPAVPSDVNASSHSIAPYPRSRILSVHISHAPVPGLGSAPSFVRFFRKCSISSYGDRPNDYEEVSEYFRAHFIQVHRRKDVSHRPLYLVRLLALSITQFLRRRVLPCPFPRSSPSCGVSRVRFLISYTPSYVFLGAMLHAWY